MSPNEVNTEGSVQEILKDYEKLLQLLILLNENLVGDATFQELKVFALEHQRQLDSLKEKLGKAAVGAFEDTLKNNHILEKIKTEEEKAKKMIEAGLESIKIEFTRIQDLKRVYPNYQKPLETEARFFDSSK